MAVENRERLNEILRELKDGMSSNPVSVREFISWFGAERRGYMVAYKIRKALESLGVKTEPDFDSVPLDAKLLSMHLRGMTQRPMKQVNVYMKKPNQVTPNWLHLKQYFSRMMN